MASDNRQTFVFSLEWHEVLMDYAPEVRLEVYDAIMEYARSGTVPDLKPLSKMAFSFIQKDMDRNTQRYEEIVEKRKVAGRKGGAPVGNDNAAKTSKNNQNKQKQPKQPKQAKTSKTSLNDNDNEYDYDYIVVDDMGREEFVEDFFAPERRATIEQLCISRKFGDVDKFRRLADAVLNEWAAVGRKHSDVADARRHLIDHCTRKLEAERRLQSNNTTDGTKHNPNTDRQAAIRQLVADRLGSPDAAEPDISDFY